MANTTFPIDEFTFRGINIQVFGGITDSRGRDMYYATVDGEKERAKKRMA